MTKFEKSITLSIAPYKTVRIAITEAKSFEECDKELMEEINRFPELKKLNKEEIEKTIRGN
jgi:hypothetical protein